MKELFDNLMALCEGADASFFFKDCTRDGQRFRIFNYRLASYTEFCKPGALEARGIMFLMDDTNENNPIKIVCRPMPKFFGFGENPFTMSLDTSKIVEYQDKVDGSLISTYLYGSHGNHILGLKTKGSLFSDQAIWAEELIQRKENVALLHDLYELTLQGWTVNMELISPRNQIVVPYEIEELVVLNIRNNETGLVLHKSQVYGKKNFVWVRSWKNVDFPSIPNMKGIEGFVIRFEDGQLVKIKTDEYLALHKTKDSVTIPRRLFECVILESTDNLKQLFRNDPLSLTRIEEMENDVRPKYNHMISFVEKYYEENRNLVRKDYAIKGKEILGDYFGLAMNKYTGREPNYKEFAIKNWKIFGVKDDGNEDGKSNEDGS
jgi:T4 RnlA family RNA ligase